MIFVVLSSWRPDSSTQLVNNSQSAMAAGARVRRRQISATSIGTATTGRVDTNSLFLTAQLNRLGIEVTRKTVVGDELDAMRDAFGGALERVELVIRRG